MVKLNGHPTWTYVGPKRGTSLVLLHGGMSSSASLLRSVGPRLAKKFQVSAFDRRGHGATPDTAAPFHYDAMAEETVAFLEHLGRRSHLVGHSDGAIVALLVAMRRPDLVRRVVAVGANYHHEGLSAFSPPDYGSDQFLEWAIRFAERSPDGLDHARVVAEKTMTLFATEPTLTTEDLAAISVPVLVMVGDDEPISLSHTTSLYESLPDAQLCVVPGTSHALLKERPKECSRIIRRFLESALPPLTLQPVRRAPRS